jgi:hypothetical protein
MVRRGAQRCLSARRCHYEGAICLVNLGTLGTLGTFVNLPRCHLHPLYTPKGAKVPKKTDI